MKNKNITRIFIIFILLILYPIQSFATHAEYIDFNSEDNSSLEIYAKGVVLMDENSGKVLYEKNANERMFPASTTKIITGLLTLDKCNLSDVATVSYYAVHSVPATYTIMNLLPGETFTIKDLLNILMIGSANDAAFVLAEYIANGGNNYPIDSSQETKNKFDESIKTFSDMMNEKAKEIGCNSTNFVNPNGIHNENHYSTPYDFALIAKYAYKNEQLMSICNQLSYEIPNTDLYTLAPRTCKCTNSLLYPDRPTYYQYANGMKTGYTDPAGYCLVATASKDNLNLIAVIFGSQESSYSATEEEMNITREADCLRLFNYGFDNYLYSTLSSSGEIAKTIYVLNGSNPTRKLDLIVKDNLVGLISKGKAINITPKIKVYTYLAPISSGQVIGQITYKINGLTYTSDLLASHDVVVGNYTDIVWVILAIFLVLLLVVIIICKKKKNKD